MSTHVPLPSAFVQRIHDEQFPSADLPDALETQAATSIRLNPAKTKPHLDNATRIPWSENGYFLSERPVFTLDPLFHAGSYYPQEAGSQFLDTILRQLELPENPVMLDLCAAPGGKSTLIASFLSARGLLVSNEIVPNRARILKENLSKWGCENVVVTQNEPVHFQKAGSLFDAIVADVPCSGEGMFRKDMNARSEWSPGNVSMCAARQKDIVADIWPTLKTGGLLIYSTCTFNSDENELSIQWICDELGGELVSTGIEQSRAGRGNVGHYAIPGELNTEGFFVAVIRKLSDDVSRSKPVKKSEVSLYKGDLKPVSEFISTGDHALLQWKEFLFAVPGNYSELIVQLQHHLHVIKMGVEIGEVSRKGLIPNEDLALSNDLLQPRIQRISLTKAQALHYLKGDTFPLEGKQGFALVCFEGQPLGWIKHLGNRFNNLYPKEWRIRMSIDQALGSGR